MYERILEMIKEMFSDTTRTKEETLNDLEGLRIEIDVMIESLE